jgi:adenine phosphoribosyltransferase
MTLNEIEKLIPTVKDFPKVGIYFKDMTPVLENGKAFSALIELFKNEIPKGIDKIVAIESRGFILGAALACTCELGLVIARKPGKLPRATESERYELEYGFDELQIHKDSLKANDRVLVIDDVLATGGTASAAERLCKKVGAEVVKSLFLLEINALDGRSRIQSEVVSLIKV